MHSVHLGSALSASALTHTSRRDNTDGQATPNVSVKSSSVDSSEKPHEPTSSDELENVVHIESFGGHKPGDKPGAFSGDIFREP
eukprot:scaffold125853_cov23-Prasinocladus_malaysianus.AAC.1